MMDDPRSEAVRTRFAPSPTGFLQLGNVRTALFTYLFAKKNQGVFILRIEDTDQERSRPEYEKDIFESLRWLGLNWDEGPEADGLCGPYRQSEKLDVYENYLKKLLAEGKAFYCFCSEEESEAYRQYQLSQGLAPVYSGKCRDLGESEIAENFRQGKKAIIRFKISQSEKVIFDDLIRGKVEFDPKLIGDFSIARDLKSPLYNFSCVVDDFEMKITHVIRGEEHLSNTPRQIFLQQALGFPQLKYAHLPIIFAPDRSKLSKRHGAVPVKEYRAQGYLAEALVNFLALLGWHPEDEREIFSLAGLIKEFSLARVQKSGAVFNEARLDWINGFYLRSLSPENLTTKCLPFLIDSDLVEVAKESLPAQLLDLPIEEKPKEQKYQIRETGQIVEFGDLVRVVGLYQQRLKKLSEIAELTDFFFKAKLVLAPELLAWKEMDKKEIKESLEKAEKILSKIKKENWQKENLEPVLLNEAEKAGDRGRLLWPLRVALTGKEASASPFEVAWVLGREKTLQRIQDAKNLLK
jgi:glutamyl-tRNA synthetase